MAANGTFWFPLLLRASAMAAAPVKGVGERFVVNLGDFKGGEPLKPVESWFGDCSDLPRFRDFVRAGCSGRTMVSWRFPAVIEGAVVVGSDAIFFNASLVYYLMRLKFSLRA